jgi:hypothetical protein
MTAASDWFDIPLPWPLSYLPSIFRFLSLAYIAPVILLSVIDVGTSEHRTSTSTPYL